MNLRVAVSLVALPILSLALGLAACRDPEPHSSEEQLWSLGGATYGTPPQDAGPPRADARPPMPDAGVPHDGGHSHDAGWPFDAGDGYPDGAPPRAPKTVYDGGTGETTAWKDTDGIVPELAGCHVEYRASDCNTGTTGRKFGETCSTGNDLIETNPGADRCHDHEGDIGHPYVVDCDAWCRNALVIPTNTQSIIRGTAARSGRCQVIGYLPCDGGFVDSARCLCSDVTTPPPEGYPGN